MAIGGQNTYWGHGTLGALSSLTDFSAKTMSVSISASQETVDATVFGDAYRDATPTFKTATITVKYKYDTTVFGQISALYNGASVPIFQLGPDGTTGGYVKITGSCFITSFGTPIEVGGVLVMDVTWETSGAITWSTF